MVNTLLFLSVPMFGYSFCAYLHSCLNFSYFTVLNFPKHSLGPSSFQKGHHIPSTSYYGANSNSWPFRILFNRHLLHPSSTSCFLVILLSPFISHLVVISFIDQACIPLATIPLPSPNPY
ncbi:hypothetical protein F4818DRAFT_394446 [Hypoxylon cercidicola]|nr:hypothetical protein F4818DRAFT_394446 [Hypoxylon cercidicola]